MSYKEIKKVHLKFFFAFLSFFRAVIFKVKDLKFDFFPENDSQSLVLLESIKIIGIDHIFFEIYEVKVDFSYEKFIKKMKIRVFFLFWSLKI